MKEKVKIAILLFFISFLSAVNLRSGLVFKVTDSTELDVAFSTNSDVPEKYEPVKSSLKSVNIPAAPAKTAKTSATSKKSTSNSVKLRYNSNLLNRVSCSVKGIPATHSTKINYCVYSDAAGAGTGTFYYGHETGVFKNLKTLNIGDTFVMGNKTYRVANKFYKSTAELNSNSALRTKLFKSTGYDITIQTCNGQNSRLYIQANAI